MAIGTVEPDGKENGNLEDGIEKPQNQVFPERYVDDAVLQAIADPKSYRDHQIDDDRVRQCIQSVQKLLLDLINELPEVPEISE